MKTTILSLVAFLFILPIEAQYTVTGGAGRPLLAENNAQFRIEVYLLQGLDNASISFRSAEEEPHSWYRYNTRYSDAVPLTASQTGALSTIENLSDGWAYFVETPSHPTPTFVWIIDYNQHRSHISSLAVQEEDDRCEWLKLVADVTDSPLSYRTYSGATIALTRTYRLLYDKLEWDDEALSFALVSESTALRGTPAEMIVEAPLVNTTFTLEGDAFAEHFGEGQRLSTPEYQAMAVQTHTLATKMDTDTDPELLDPDAPNLVSAPVDIRFEAYANEPVAALYIWTILRTDPETGEESTVARYADRSLTYAFHQSGNYSVRAEVLGIGSLCSQLSPPFTIRISESQLKLPNAFSPGSSPGINDEYRVAYRSLVRFKAAIFNRWGSLIYQWEDPARGWNGMLHGRFVPTGVYYIVVEALGADGKEYHLTKDINILRVKE
jgi:gliding motility-associated-like protein